MLESIKEKDHTWDDMNIKLFTKKLIRKEKGNFSQAMEVALLAQKHFESKKNKKICNYYKQLGHWARNCKKKRSNALHKQKAKEGNVVDSKVQVFVLALFASSSENDTWHIDSNASMHLSFHKEWFRDYERIPPIKIYMGDDLV